MSLLYILFTYKNKKSNKKYNYRYLLFIIYYLLFIIYYFKKNRIYYLNIYIVSHDIVWLSTCNEANILKSFYGHVMTFFWLRV